MKDTKNMPPEAENNSVTPKERAEDEALTSNTDSQVDKSQITYSKVMATHGFLKILSTIKRR